jgi:hypothetical protein
VRFNGFSAAHAVNSATKITATVPAAMIGSGKVAVTTPAGTGISAATFVLLTPPVTVAALQARLPRVGVDHKGICTHFSQRAPTPDEHAHLRELAGLASPSAPRTRHNTAWGTKTEP